MSRAKHRGHRRILPLRTIRRRNSSSNSTTHQARITGEAEAVKAKRATDRLAMLTSTPAGASTVRLGPWVSQVQAESHGRRQVSVFWFFLAAFRKGFVWRD